jgi:GPI mannosyltransferase 3
MALGDALAPGTSDYLIMPKLALGLCSLALLWAGWRLGRAVSPLHGWAALAVACWYEFVQMGVHPLMEPLASAAIVPGAALLLTGSPGRRGVMLGAFLLAIGVVLRFHYGPAVAVIGLAALWGQWRARFWPMLVGGLVAGAISGAVDLWAGQIPFAWIVANVRFNIVHDVASQFGVTPATAYLGAYIDSWGWARIPIFLMILPAIRHHRALFWAAVLNLAVHSLIGHKEYRFVFLTTAIFILLSAIGTVDVLAWMRQRFAPRVPVWSVLAAIPLWVGASASLAATPPRNIGWTQFGATLELMAQAGRTPGACGVAVERRWFWFAGAHVTLRRDIPLYAEAAIDPAAAREGAVPNALPGYNLVIGPDRMQARLPREYRIVACRASGRERDFNAYADGARVCLFQRPGPCRGEGLENYRAQAVLERFGR